MAENRRDLLLPLLHLPEKSTTKSSNNQEIINNKIKITKKCGEEVTVPFEKLKFIKQFESSKLEVQKCYSEEANMNFVIKGIKIDNYSEPVSDMFSDIKPFFKAEKSPFITQLFGACQVYGMPYILTECMDISLNRFYLTAHKLNVQITESFLSKIAFSVLKSMEYLNAYSINYLSVGTSKILINYDGTIKLCSFGKCMVEENINHTRIHVVPTYLSPEAIYPPQNYRQDTTLSNIWSLGLTLVETVTGTYPYPYVNVSFFGLLTAILEQEPPKLPIDQQSFDLCSFVELCLKKDPSERAGLYELLNHSFISAHLNTEIDLNFIKTIIDSTEDVYD